MKRLCLLFCLFCLPFACPAQETAASGEPGAQSRRADSPSSIAADLDSARFAGIDRKLETLVERDSTFARTVDVTAGRLPLTELLRNIARASGVNLSVRSVENIPVSCNFTRTRVDDLVRFLCREYRLDVETTGNIVSVFPAAAAPPTCRR